MKPFDHRRIDHIAKHAAKLARPQNTLYSALLAAGTAYIITGSAAPATACLVFIYAVYAVAAGYNNLQDRATDRINDRHDNPLATNALGRTELQYFFAFHAIVGLVALAFLREPYSLLIAAAFLFLIIGYSHPAIRLQARGWLAPLTLSLCYGALPLALGLAQASGPLRPDIMLLALQILLLAPLLLAKDYKDETGDEATGKLTPLVRYGRRVVIGVAMGLAAAATALLIYVGLAAEIRPAILAVSGVAYLSYCYRLHALCGQGHPYERKFVGLALLALQLSLVAGIFGHLA